MTGSRIGLGALLALMLLVQPAYAQFGFGVPDLTLSISPEYPSPRSTVRIRAESSSLDLLASDIAWYADGKKTAEGTGLTGTDIVAGALGSVADIEAVVSEGGEELASARATIRPTELDLLWQSDSYVPPFFRGRALPSAGTALSLQAIPRFIREDGSVVPNSDIVFTWRKNGSVQTASGRGRSAATLSAPSLFGTDTISVEARSTDGTLSNLASVTISSMEPLLALYEDHSLFGVLYHQALSAQTLIPEIEMSFAAVPYFAPASSPDDGTLEYTWSVNGHSIASSPERPSAITINAENSSGIAQIGLGVTSLTNFFMDSRGAWGVVLSSSAAASPFGGSAQ